MALRKDKNFTKENIENYVKLSFKILDVTNISVESETCIQYSNSDLVTLCLWKMNEPISFQL